METDAVMDVEYREHYDRGAAAGRDAQRALPDAELAGVRIRVRRIADALETAWYQCCLCAWFSQGDRAGARVSAVATAAARSPSSAAVVANTYRVSPAAHR